MKKISNTAKRLNYILNYKGLKQADLVRQTNLPKSAISQYLSGKVEPKQDNLYIIAEALNVSEAWLMGYDTEMKKTISSNIINLSNQEKALINKYRQLNEQQQYKVMGYIDSELHHTDTVRETSPVYKIDNNTHLKVAENEYEYKGERYIKTDVAAYGATEDETMIADIEKFKIADKKMQKSIDEDIRKQKEYEEGVIKRVMKKHNISREEAIERIKNL